MTFNAAKSRTKYALPVWVDAFVRDTLDLSADEIGAFNLLLWAMWSRESCNLPDDDRKLSRVARVTPQTWRRRVRPALEQFFVIESGTWSSVRLLREARKTENFLKAQSDRKTGGNQEIAPFARHGGAQLADKKTANKSRKSLKTNDPTPTGDISADQSPDHPTQETKIYGGGGDARAREADFDDPGQSENPAPEPAKPPGWKALDREALLSAMGVDPVSGLTGTGGRMVGGIADMQVAGAWVDDLGLTPAEIETVITEVIAKKTDGPPSSFRYFTNAMQRYAGEKARPALRPITGDNHERNHDTRSGQPVSAASRAHTSLAAAFVRAVSDDD